MTLIAWIVVLVVVVLMVVGIVSTSHRREITEDEFECKARRPSVLRAGLIEFQSYLEPEKRAAIEAVREEKRKREQQEQGDPPQAGQGYRYGKR